MPNKQPIFLQDLGMRYATPTSKIKYRYGLYQCQYCGKEFEANTHNIKSGNTKSCGCQVTTHTLSCHRLYSTWANMKERCTNPKSKSYKNYGARGIKVCDRWLSIENFIEDMYPSFQEGLTLDRVNITGDYEPNNCRWIDRDIQNRNTRDIQINNTSGYRGVSLHKKTNKWIAQIKITDKNIYLGLYQTALEAAKAYETYVRKNNLEHNFTPVLTDEEILALSFDKA